MVFFLLVYLIIKICLIILLFFASLLCLLQLEEPPDKLTKHTTSSSKTQNNQRPNVKEKLDSSCIGIVSILLLTCQPTQSSCFDMMIWLRMVVIVSPAIIHCIKQNNVSIFLTELFIHTILKYLSRELK